jgi:RNA polymerase sigma factor (sigma-70 family)
VGGGLERDISGKRNSSADALVEKLAHDCGPDLVRFIARRVRSIVDARDLAQETYVRLLRLDRKDLIRDPRPYLYRIASNILYEFEIKRKADLVGLNRWSSEGRDRDAESADEGEENLILARRLDEALCGLSPKCRAVVVLHRQEGMTYEEIGTKIGISPSMVKKYLAQGLKHCRERLKDVC